MKRRSIIVSLAASVALVIAVAAVSASKHHDQQASGTQVAAPTRGEGGVGSTVGRFTTTDIDGRTRTVPAGRPGALFFFAGWCGDCLPEALALVAVRRGGLPTTERPAR